MNIILDTDGPRVVEPEDLKSFMLVVVGSRETELSGEVRGGLGEAGEFSHDGRHAFIDPVWIKKQVGGLAEDLQWSSGFEAMIAFATKKGWVDEKGRVRGHVERR